ncbi:MAG: roadblock/LC7 domain-containing protein [Myxococcota bacterium]
MAINLESLASLDGFIGACVVDSESGMVLGSLGGGDRINLDIAAAGNTEVIRAKRKTVKSLALQDEIEDILISLGSQYHIMRPLETNDALFLYLALDRERANLGLARHQAKQLDKTIQI